ncbi:MAG: GNAT family N-acetyltransferase [Gemmatimonadales bacterium]
MDLDVGEWLCVGPYCWEATPALLAFAAATLHALAAVIPTRVRVRRWARYRVDLDQAPPPPDIPLTPVTEELLPLLEEHAGVDADQLNSGLRFWRHGLRRAYVWLGEDGPRCVQWLLTRPDAPQLRTLEAWAGMYPPLRPQWGQVENLFTFPAARQKGVATQFEYALYREARRAGVSRLLTHIYEQNSAARGWADRTGWRQCGNITRYEFDLPGLRRSSVCLHWASVPARG